jgi:hypothetical protein
VGIHPVRKRVALAVVAVMTLVMIGIVVVLIQVHSATADWWPLVIPTRVQYDGRNFTCAGDDGAVAVPTGLEPRGRTIGGGTILAPPGDVLPAQIVVAADGRAHRCDLSGAP